MYELRLGLQDGGRDDHRPLESRPAAVSDGNVLLRPLSCALYSAGPTRKVPGRRGMSYEEEGWVDDEVTSHRSPDE